MGKIGYGYGSEWHLLRLMGRHRNYLNGMIISSIGWGSKIDWLDFCFTPGDLSDQELKGLSFLSSQGIPGWERIEQQWRKFWPQTGNPPNWDAVGWLDNSANNSINRELLLVEAKAHLGEIRSVCKATSPVSIEKIRIAFEEVQKDLGISPLKDWLTPYYQYANRVATLWFLHKHGIKAHLINIYFVGDKNPKATCPIHQSQWVTPITQVINAIGIPNNHPIRDRIHHIFIPLL